MRGSATVARAAAGAALTLVAGALLGASPARAATTSSTGSLSFSGDQGDWISGGSSYSYSTAAGDGLNASGDGNHVSVSVSGHNGDWWYLDLAAPTGQTLTAGTTYPNATRYPFQGTGGRRRPAASGAASPAAVATTKPRPLAAVDPAAT